MNDNDSPAHVPGPMLLLVVAAFAWSVVAVLVIIAMMVRP